MAKTITVAGKGGVGKTAISSLLIDALSKKGVVLAIDADPSTNLNEALGMEVGGTIGQAREDLTDAIQKVVTNKATPKEALTEAQTKITCVIKKQKKLIGGDVDCGI